MDADRTQTQTTIIARLLHIAVATLLTGLLIAPLPGSAQLAGDANTNVDVDSSDETEANARLRSLPGSDVPAIADPVLLSRMLIPGKGIQILPIGTSFEQIMLEYGPPLKESNTGLLGKTRNWLYQADDGTDIILSGKDQVDEISVRGATDSTFITQEGLAFGMEALEIIAFYGNPENDDQEKSFDYASQGIRFELESGRIRVIVLSEPAS